MGGGYSCPICPETGSENAHSTTVSLFAFSWTSWHAQSLSVGMLLGVVLVISLICFCGNKFIECILPRSCLDFDNKHRRHGSRHYDNRYDMGCERMHYAKNSNTCRTVSIPMPVRHQAPQDPAPYHAHTAPSAPSYGFDVEATKRLMLTQVPNALA